MQFITATRNAVFQNPIYGPGVLKRGKIYYTFGQFARETVAHGLARHLDRDPIPVRRFLPKHLRGPDRPQNILLLLAGGWGDAVTLGIVLPAAIAQYRLNMDICCDSAKWEMIFRPMSFPGRHVPFPPDLEILQRYEAVLYDISDFFPGREGLRIPPISQLLAGFRLPDQEIRAAYRMDPEIRKRMQLPARARRRVGLNFDSNGRVKSYPMVLRPDLINLLLQPRDLELYLFGKSGPDAGRPAGSDLYDWRGKTTVPELAALLAQMDLVMGVDSFIVHLADLLERPALVLLATTAAEYFARHRHIACMPSALECSPCFAFSDQCPKHYPDCRAFLHPDISPAVIARRVRELLAS